MSPPAVLHSVIYFPTHGNTFAKTDTSVPCPYENRVFVGTMPALSALIDG